MPRYAAFLRAINVGGHTVRMERLKELFTGLGFSGVETFLASGNVIFTAKSQNAGVLERRIGQTLGGALGYPVATFVRTLPELAAVAACAPFPEADAASAKALNVVFLAGDLSPASAAKIRALETPIDTFQAQGRELYWLCRVRQSESTFSNAVLERTLSLEATFRGVKTIRRMADRYCGGAAGARA